MIKWDEFEHIHVVKKLKEILSSWWNIDVLFTDEDGNIRGTDFSKPNFCNKAVQEFLLKESIRKNLASTIAQSVEELRDSENKFSLKKWDVSGFDIITVPIIIKNDFMGSVCALGFLKDQSSESRLSEIKERLSAITSSPKNIESHVSQIKCINNNEQSHFTELVELVAQEIITLHLEITSREDRIGELNKEVASRYKYNNMIGKSKPMQNLYSLLDKIKGSDSTVLIHGENGTGKELIAKAIHYNSNRKNKSIVIQNCSAFNDNLLESELFGHVKGSFTGANRDKKGLFEIADKGTFFLDEIGDTSQSMQVKLLRVIQDGSFTPVGAIEPKVVDVRIVAATNRKLKEMVTAGTFREDLYYRLNVINIQVPPLRERKEDIPLLADFFLSHQQKKVEGQKNKILTKQALGKLLNYPWPGNVRELQNEIERVLVLSSDAEMLNAEMLSPKISNLVTKIQMQGSRLQGKLKDALEALEKEMIREGLRRTGWNKSQLAKDLGVSRAGLIMKVEKYDLDKRRKNN